LTTLQPKNNQLNAIVYVDYENILELLKAYGKDPLEIDFFRVIQDRLMVAGLKVIDFIVYGNFEKKDSNNQTFLRAMGFQTRHALNSGKNSGDLELTVDALKDLYKNPNINIFVIVSSGRDFIPLLKAIKYENKLSFVYSTKNGFNQIVAQCADFHEFVEDIFDLALPDSLPVTLDGTELLIDIDPDTVNMLQLRRAREVSRYFYQSHIWTRSSILGKPVTLAGYMDVITKVVERSPDEILEDFKLAHSIGYIKLYRDPERGVCIKEGELMGRVNK
jgi:uncharacterized LabA/DUF88 family protein